MVPPALAEAGDCDRRFTFASPVPACLDGVPARTRTALAAALACTGALVAGWLLTFRLAPARWLDSAVLEGFVGLRGSLTERAASGMAGLADPVPFVVAGAALTAVALARGRRRLAVAVPLVLLGAAVTSQVLKPLLASPRFAPWLDPWEQITAGSWPSGHATGAMALALCAVLVAPARARPWVGAAGAAFAVAVSYSILTLGWHYASDVLAGFLVAGGWSALGVAWVAAAPAPSRPALAVDELIRPAAAGWLAAAGAVGLVVLARPHQVVWYAAAHTAFVVGAVAIAAIAAAMATALTFALRH